MKKALLLALAIIVVVAGYFYHKSHSGAGEAAKANMLQSPTAVTSLVLQPQAVVDEIELPGRTNASEMADIRPQASGILRDRLFREGQKVAAGTPLYQIDPKPSEAAYASARAAVLRAEANLSALKARHNRYQELVSIDAVSKQEVDDVSAQMAQAQADISSAKAALANAQLQLGYTKVASPINGYVGDSTVTKGALLTANQPAVLTTVTRLDPLYIDMTQSAQDHMQLRKQLEGLSKPAVKIYLQGESKPFPVAGELQFSGVLVDEQTGSVKLRASIANPDGVLMPGLFVRSRIQLGQQDVILVPQRATVRGADGKLSVFVIAADNTVQARPIEVSRTHGDQWIITSGVAAGEKIVLEGLGKIQPGAKVEPAEAAEDNKAPSAAKGA